MKFIKGQTYYIGICTNHSIFHTAGIDKFVYNGNMEYSARLYIDLEECKLNFMATKLEMDCYKENSIDEKAGFLYCISTDKNKVKKQFSKMLKKSLALIKEKVEEAQKEYMRYFDVYAFLEKCRINKKQLLEV
jgi:hypothetical protein